MELCEFVGKGLNSFIQKRQIPFTPSVLKIRCNPCREGYVQSVMEFLTVFLFISNY